MIRDITLGQYYKKESVIHRLDPRTKIVLTFVFLLSLFLGKNILLYGLATLFLVVYVALSKVPFGKILKGLSPIWILLAITFLMSLFTLHGEEPIWQWWLFKISYESIKTSIYISVRLVYLVIGASIITYTTTPTKLTDGLELLFAPLSKIGVPVHDIAMMMSIALRFIPVLVEELDRIMKAQEARGARFSEGNIMNRVKAMLPIVIPLFVSAFKRARDLAIAMDARCYQGGDKRTKLHPLKYERRDAVCYLLVFLYGAICDLMVAFPGILSCVPI